MEDYWFADLFTTAVVRLATYVEGTTSKPRLLFGTVSLLTKDRPHPKSSVGVEKLTVDKNKAAHIFYRRVVMEARQAITWYRGASGEKILTPVPAVESEIKCNADGTQISGGPFFDDPAWPDLGMPAGLDVLSASGGPENPAPFIGVGTGPARIHRRFGNNQGFDAVIASRDAIAFLGRRLHLNLADYTEYLGSLALIVPNPVIQQIDHFISPRSNGSEQLVIRLIPRLGQTFDDLSLTIVERRGKLISRFEATKVPDNGLVVIDEQLPVEQSGYILAHSRYGLLAYQPPLPFLRSARLSLGIVNRIVKIEAPKTDSLKSESAGYVVHEVVHDVPSHIGEVTPERAVSRVYMAEAQRELRDQAKRYDQTWFDDGDRDGAIAFVRNRIARAHERVIIADPYFGAHDQMRFLHVIPWPGIDLRILTSRLAFENNDENRSFAHEPLSGSGETHKVLPTERQREAERLDAFSRALKTFEQRSFKSVSARVLLGKVPPLHDRFLVVDHAVWFLGNSLNALGLRASLILKVPDPEPILGRLLAMDNSAIPFEKYHERRRKNAMQRPRKQSK